MISAQAKQGIDHIFTKSARKSLVLDQEDSCEINAVSGNEVRRINGESDAVILTISSFLFKVLTILHIGDDEATRSYFLRKPDCKSVTEAFSELGNLCTGAMNHELLRYFPHLGMSTPYALKGKSLAYLPDLNPTHLSHHDIVINGQARLQATVCVCGYAPLDFSVDTSDTADSSGELELF